MLQPFRVFNCTTFTLFILQCSNTVFGRQEGHPACKKARCWSVDGDDLTGALHIIYLQRERMSFSPEMILHQQNPKVLLQETRLGTQSNMERSLEKCARKTKPKAAVAVATMVVICTCSVCTMAPP